MRQVVFPIMHRCLSNGQSHHDYRTHFLGAKPKDMTWFAYDTNILSRTVIEFIVYNMRDNVIGGVGDEIARFKTVVPASITRQSVEDAIHALAQRRRDAELIAAEARIVNDYANEIRASLNEVEPA